MCTCTVCEHTFLMFTWASTSIYQLQPAHAATQKKGLCAQQSVPGKRIAHLKKVGFFLSNVSRHSSVKMGQWLAIEPDIWMELLHTIGLREFPNLNDATTCDMLLKVTVMIRQRKWKAWFGIAINVWFSSPTGMERWSGRGSCHLTRPHIYQLVGKL